MPLLHIIVLPLRLMGLVIVIVALIKEPLVKVTCAISSEEFSVPFILLPSGCSALINNDQLGRVLVLISQLRNRNSSLVHQNTAISLEHIAVLPLT